MNGLNPRIADDPALLVAMLMDEHGQGSLYKPGPYWLGYQQRVNDAIRRYGIGDFRARAAVSKGYADIGEVEPRQLWRDQGTWRGALKQAIAKIPPVSGMLSDYATVVRGQQKTLRRLRDAYYEDRFGALVREAVAGGALQYTTMGGSTETVEIGGRSYARLYVEFLARIHSFRTKTDFGSARTAFEIGGGFGAWLHLMLQLYPNIRKAVYLDIPPMIYIGTQYLKGFFGDAVRDYRDLRGRTQIKFQQDDSLEILCICPWQIEQLDASIDVFWNSGSFSEMTPEIVANYARHVGRVLNPASGAACLVMNKSKPHPTLTTTMADEILGSFKNIAFSKFEPEIDHERGRTFAVGRVKRS